MKKIIKMVVVFIGSVVVVLVIISQILFNNPLSLIYIPVWIIEARKGIDEQYNKAIRKEEINREENMIVAEKWLIDTYGEIIAEVTAIEFSNRSQGWGIDSVFHIESPFATGSIYVNSDTKEVSGGFNLGKDSKFQYLYSEWVKKQIGIEDENVKIEFYVKDKILIDFKQIESISDDCSDIFKNVYNCELDRIYIKNFPNLSLDNFVNYVKNFVNEKYSKLASLSSFTDGFIIFAYGYDYDMYVPNSSQYVNYYGTKDNINNYSIGVTDGKLSNNVMYCYMDEKKGTYYIDEIIIS